MKQKSAVIFDMDGVISDTQNIHAQTESDIFKLYGVELSAEEITRKYAGFKDYDFFETVLKQYHLEDFIEDAIARKKAKLYEEVKGLKEIDGATALIKKLSKAGFPLAVASGSPKFYIEKVLNYLKVKDYFQVVLSTEEVKLGKPAPDAFLRAAELLGVIPELCTVIEDGRNGMIAAKVAGMKCVGLVPDKSLVDEYRVDKLVESMRELGVGDFVIGD